MEIKSKAYSPELAKLLIPALGDYSTEILGEIKHGQAHIWQIENTFFVVRIEQTPTVREMVIVAAVGEGLKETSRRVVEQADIIGCQTIRFHTQRPALVALMNLPFYESERVYRMKIGGEHGSQ